MITLFRPENHKLGLAQALDEALDDIWLAVPFLTTEFAKHVKMYHVANTEYLFLESTHSLVLKRSNFVRYLPFFKTSDRLQSNSLLKITITASYNRCLCIVCTRHDALAGFVSLTTLLPNIFAFL